MATSIIIISFGLLYEKINEITLKTKLYCLSYNAHSSSTKPCIANTNHNVRYLICNATIIRIFKEKLFQRIARE